MKTDVIAIIGGIIFVLSLGVFFLKNENSGAPYTNCKSFSNHDEAQRYFLKNNAVHLDRDKDGIACESLI